jgi:hypothetical protein
MDRPLTDWERLHKCRQYAGSAYDEENWDDALHNLLTAAKQEGARAKAKEIYEELGNIRRHNDGKDVAYVDVWKVAVMHLPEAQVLPNILEELY